MRADDDRYVPNPDGPLARGLPPGYLRNWRTLAWGPWDGQEARPVRRFLWWVLLCLGLQWLAFNGLMPRATEPFGLLAQAINHAVTPWPLFLFFALLLPALAFPSIVPPPQVSFRRAALFGLASAAVLLSLVTLVLGLGFLDSYWHSQMSRADFIET